MPDLVLGAVDGGSQLLRGYLAVPAGEGPWPGVVVIHEIFGLQDMMRRQADRMAAAGYLTVAPDLFSDGGARRCVVGTMRALGEGSGKPFADIEAARDYLARHSDCTGKVGVIGFCMGGGFALAAAPTGFDVSAVNYGQLPKDPVRDLAGACPVVASYGERDMSLRGAAGKLEEALAQLGVDHDVTEYPTPGHSFLNDKYFGPKPTHILQRILHVGPDPVAAPDAWRRIEAFFAEHLAAG